MLSPSLRASASWQSMWPTEIRSGAAALAEDAANGESAAISSATAKPIPRPFPNSVMRELPCNSITFPAPMPPRGRPVKRGRPGDGQNPLGMASWRGDKTCDRRDFDLRDGLEDDEGGRAR